LHIATILAEWQWILLQIAKIIRLNYTLYPGRILRIGLLPEYFERAYFRFGNSLPQNIVASHS